MLGAIHVYVRMFMYVAASTGVQKTSFEILIMYCNLFEGESLLL